MPHQPDIIELLERIDLKLSAEYPDTVLSFKQISKIMGVSVATLDRLRQKGLLKRSEHFGSWRGASLKEVSEIFKKGQ